MKTHWLMSGVSGDGFTWMEETTEQTRRGMGFEAVLGPPNFKEIWWLECALQAARSVARVKMANGAATGFLIGPDLFLTNNHVFETEGDAAAAVLQFNYRLLAGGDVAPRDEWRCDPESLFKTNPELDYTVVRIKQKGGKRPGDLWGFYDVNHGTTVRTSQRVNIIQHPQGRFQEIAFRDNQVKAVGEIFIQYLTDTDYGTSGSPVFDDWFNVVALHNQRVPDPNNPQRWYRNQGYRIEAIIEDMGILPPA